MKWKRWALIMLALGIVVISTILIFAYPYFALQRPSGGKALVVEGWMPREGLLEARAVFLTGGYDHIYVTGTERPFAYYLVTAAEVHIQPRTPVKDQIAITIGGLPTTKWSLVSGTDTLITERCTATATTTTIPVKASNLIDLKIITRTSHYAAPDVPIAFIKALELDGIPAHTGSTTIIQNPDSSRSPGRPSHAEEGRKFLIDAGIPSEKLTAVPTPPHTGSRTIASGKAFVAYARAHNIGAFDIATIGVHARRTWNSYVAAAGTEDGIGVLSLYDTNCQRWTWWRSSKGRVAMLKELFAFPACLAGTELSTAEFEE